MARFWLTFHNRATLPQSESHTKFLSSLGSMVVGRVVRVPYGPVDKSCHGKSLLSACLGSASLECEQVGGMEGVTAQMLRTALANKRRLDRLEMFLLEQSDAWAGIGFPDELLNCPDLSSVEILVKRHGHRRSQPLPLALPPTCNFQHLYHLDLVRSLPCTRHWYEKRPYRRQAPAMRPPE